MRPLLIVRAGDVVPAVAAVHGEWPDVIRRALGPAWKSEVIVVDARTTECFPDPMAAAAILVTGSSSSVTERAPWMLRTEAFLRTAVEADAPILGICFGHQLLAQALGGEVAKNPRGREIGTVVATRLAEDPLFEALGDSFEVQATHVDTVARLPPGARLLATTQKDDVAAFAVGDHVRAVQFHPEIDEEVMRGYVDARAPLIEKDGLDVIAIRRGVVPTPDNTRILQNFVRRFAAP